VSDLVLSAGAIAVAALVVAPAVVLMRRLKSGDAPAVGGSMGRQLAGREKRSWGPKSAR